MVALAGSTWKLAPCLVRLFEEADKLWPGRSTASDGSIGDLAHSTRKSDHNPNDAGWVLAGDLTDDKAGGCDADRFAEHLLATRDPRVSYVICNGRIFRSYGTSAWQWTPYTGTNAHDKHTHVSVLNTAAAIYDTSPWFAYADTPAPPEDPFMALSDAEQAQLLRAVVETREIAEHNRWNRDVLDGISQAVSKIAAGDGASATEILDALAARLAG